MTCTCAGTGFRRCDEHHCYWNADVELPSVNQIIRATWPRKDGPGPSPEVLENARERGVEVDRLFSAYVIGELAEIPAGTRQDSIDLFLKLQTWWDKQSFSEVRSQVMMHNSQYAGTCDLIADDRLFDLKCVYDLDRTYEFQLGGYAELARLDDLCDVWILHCTKRFKEVKPVRYDLTTALRNWNTIHDMWKLVNGK